jgi:hypothetical protein
LNNAGLAANAVITQVDFADAEYPLMQFTCVGYLSEAQRAQIAELAGSDDVQEAITVAPPKPLPTLPPAPAQTQAPATGFTPPPPSQTPIVQPAVAPTPAPAEAPATGFAQVATPVVTELLPPEAPAAPVADAGSTDDLQNILNNWANPKA